MAAALVQKRLMPAFERAELLTSLSDVAVST